MEQMNITSAQYKNDTLTGEENAYIEAQIDGETMSVPLDLNNRHYAEILKQVAEGTLTIADAE